MTTSPSPKISPSQQAEIQQEYLNRVRWKKDPLSWAVEHDIVRRESIQWSLLPEYKNHKWHSTIRLPGETVERPCVDPIKTILDALGRGVRRIGIFAARGVGKTYIGGHIVAPWFSSVYPAKSRVFTFASRGDQLKTGLWKEIESVWPKLKGLHPSAEKHSMAIFWGGGESEEQREQWSIRAMTASVKAGEESATRVSGLHDENMLFVLEELQGYEPAIVNTLRRTANAPNNIILAYGNPKSETDELFRFCDHPDTLVIRISAMDHPNIVLGNPRFIPGACTQESVDEILKEKEINGDRTHPIFMAEVHGIPPVSSGECLFHARSLEAVRKANTEMIDGRRVWKVSQYDISTHDRYEKDVLVCEGRTIIYKKPEDTHLGRYMVAADVAGASLTGDWGFAVVFDRETREVVATIRMRSDGDDFIKEILRVCKIYRVKDPRPNNKKWYYPLLSYEVNGVGQLHRDRRIRNYPRLYRRTAPDKKSLRDQNLYGFSTNRATRPAMLNKGKQYSAELLYYPDRIKDEQMYEDMKAFIKNPRTHRYEAATGFHDDGVMALLQALLIDEEQDLRGRRPIQVRGPSPDGGDVEKKLVAAHKRRREHAKRKRSKRREGVERFRPRKLPKQFSP